MHANCRQGMNKRLHTESPCTLLYLKCFHNNFVPLHFTDATISPVLPGLVTTIAACRQPVESSICCCTYNSAWRSSALALSKITCKAGCRDGVQGLGVGDWCRGARATVRGWRPTKCSSWCEGPAALGPEEEECSELPGVMAGVLPLEEGRTSMEGALPILLFTCSHTTALHSPQMQTWKAEPPSPGELGSLHRG